MAEEQKIKHLVRIANTDIVGNKAIVVSMTKIKGVGYMFANAICKLAHIDIDTKAGLLTDTEVSRLEGFLKNPEKLPSWMLNRKKDYDTGEDKHLILGDLTYTNQQDVRRMQKVRSYKGVRHASGLPLRGQRTKSNFRRNKGKVVGVKKKAGAKGGRV
ncbi:MAG: 30S ribosomal protein S13 [Nanoarchaeota archaeon]